MAPWQSCLVFKKGLIFFGSLNSIRRRVYVYVYNSQGKINCSYSKSEFQMFSLTRAAMFLFFDGVTVKTGNCIKAFNVILFPIFKSEIKNSHCHNCWSVQRREHKGRVSWTAASYHNDNPTQGIFKYCSRAAEFPWYPYINPSPHSFSFWGKMNFCHFISILVKVAYHLWPWKILKIMLFTKIEVMNFI